MQSPPISVQIPVVHSQFCKCCCLQSPWFGRLDMINFKQQQTSSSDQSGFTIIESLVALLVAAILLAAIGPVIVLSVATRVQAKRIDLAANAAKTYIDGVKSGTIQAPPTTGASSGTPITISSYDAPSLGTLTCNANAYCSSPSANLYCIDEDGRGCENTSNKDFVIQAFRYNQGTITNSSGVSTNIVDPTKGYQLGVRVYRADAFKSGITLKASKDVDPQTEKNYRVEKTFTGGTGLKPIQTPLVEMTTEISNTSTTFDDFCNRLKPPTPSPSPTPSPTPSPSPTPQSQC